MGRRQFRTGWIFQVSDAMISQDRQRDITRASRVVLLFVPLRTVAINTPGQSGHRVQLGDQGFLIEVVLSCGRTQ